MKFQMSVLLALAMAGGKMMMTLLNVSVVLMKSVEPCRMLREVDFCKCSSVNRMAAGSRLPRSSHGFFLLSPTFQTHLM